MKSTRIPQRLRRYSATVSLVVALTGAALSFGTAQAAHAATSAATPGTFSCPGNTMIVRFPTMYTLKAGQSETAEWLPQVQRWDGARWVYYAQYNFFQASTDWGGTGWANMNGQPAGPTWTVNVAPGGWYAGRYYPTYYRFVNYYRWADLNNNLLTGWVGGDVSPYYAGGGGYCSF